MNRGTQITWALGGLLGAMQAPMAFGQFTTGACCLPGGSCAMVTSLQCASSLGTWDGAPSCDGVACSGACCQPNGACIDTGVIGCLLGVFHGLGTSCADVGDACVGACCTPDGGCSPTGPGNCDGHFFDLGIACEDVTCAGACCLPNGTCEELSGVDCLGGDGVFNGVETFCPDVVCPLPTGFTYQGRLDAAGGAYDGLADFRFSLWSDIEGGTQMGAAYDAEQVEVVTGLFTTDVDFGVDAFDGKSSFLQIELRPDGAPDYVVLEPRQRLAAMPYALQTRGLFTSADGLVGVGTTIPQTRLHVENGSEAGPAGGGVVQIGSSLGINLAMDENEIMARSNGAAANLYLNHEGGDLLISAAGNGRTGIGTDNPQSTLEVSAKDGTHALKATGGHAAGTWFELANTSPNGRNWQMISTGDANPAGGGKLLIKERNHVGIPLTFTPDGNIGVGTVDPQAALHVMGGWNYSHLQVDSTFNQGTWFNLNNQAMGRNWGLVSTGSSNSEGAGRLLVRDNTVGAVRMTVDVNGNVGIGTTNPQTRLDVNGVTRTKVVEITGGSDIAEPYRIAGAAGVLPQPGMVVAIDPAHTGTMRVADGAYDRMVAGIISGAGGVQPGLTLTQEGTAADGDLPVANVGRVWCWVDADAAGPVQAGDLLTTSGTPGHAMKVTDFQRANGAILGKAMSSLNQGRGLVLVLVALQ